MTDPPPPSKRDPQFGIHEGNPPVKPEMPDRQQETQAGTGDKQTAKYSYLENAGCFLFFIVAVICWAAGGIMTAALNSPNAMAGAVAVLGLSAMGVGVAYFLLRPRDK